MTIIFMMGLSSIIFYLTNIFMWIFDTEASMERDKFMSPEEAKEYGLIDNIRSEYVSG